MTHILHLGHQPTDISGVSGLLSTVAPGFDPTLDVNGIRISTERSAATPFAINIPPPTGDMWLEDTWGSGQNRCRASAASHPPRN